MLKVHSTSPTNTFSRGQRSTSIAGFKTPRDISNLYAISNGHGARVSNGLVNQCFKTTGLRGWGDRVQRWLALGFRGTWISGMKTPAIEERESAAQRQVKRSEAMIPMACEKHSTTIVREKALSNAIKIWQRYIVEDSSLHCGGGTLWSNCHFSDMLKSHVV